MDLLKPEISEYTYMHLSATSTNPSDHLVSYTISSNALAENQARAVVSICYQSVEDIMRGNLAKNKQETESKRSVFLKYQYFIYKQKVSKMALHNICMSPFVLGIQPSIKQLFTA